PLRPFRITTPTSIATRPASPNANRSNAGSCSDTSAVRATPQRPLLTCISQLHGSARIARGGRAIRSTRIPCSRSELKKVQNFYSRPPSALLWCYGTFPITTQPEVEFVVQPTLMYGRKYQKGVNWITAIAMSAFHVGAIAAFFFVTRGALLAALILYFVGGMLGIGMAYHRLLTHRGYKTYKWVEYFLTWCGTLALEGGPIFWVATHRIHHQKSDREGDPHSPREGTFWSHMGWILLGQGLHQDSDVLARYVPDLSRDPFHT